MQLADIRRQVRETEQNPKRSAQFVYACRFVTLASIVALWVFGDISPWTKVAMLFVFLWTWIDGYVDARQHFMGKLWMAAKNMERMSRD